MEKLPNLQVEIDGEKFEIPYGVIASEVIGFATRTDKNVGEENIVAFVIRDGQQLLLVEVQKQNLRPFELSKNKELKIGMFVMIMGQISDRGVVLNKELNGQMQVIDAEEVQFMEIDKLDPGVRKIIEDYDK